MVDIGSIEQERQRLLDLHRKILGQARDTVLRAYQDPHSKGLELTQSLADELEIVRHKLFEQEMRLVELRQVEAAYKELMIQHRVLEETNERLMQQLLKMDDDMGERGELLQLIDMQKAALEKNAHHIHELEDRIRVHLHNLGLLEQENQHLRERLGKMQERTQSLTGQQEEQKREMSRLRAQLRQKEMALLQANESYESLRMEYEGMYVNCPGGRDR